jgi:histone-lysine N-methyltransferase SETMAR
MLDRLICLSPLCTCAMATQFATRRTQGAGVTTSIEILRILQNQMPINFAGVVTWDEFWLFLEYSRNHVWRLWNESDPEKISQKINAKKHMVIVLWSTMGPLVGEWLPDHGTFNSTHFYEVIIPRLTSVVFPSQVTRCKQRFYVYMDNARPHSSKQSVQCINDSKFKRMLHSPYSRDIAPSDFYRFRTVK